MGTTILPRGALRSIQRFTDPETYHHFHDHAGGVYYLKKIRQTPKGCGVTNYLLMRGRNKSRNERLGYNSLSSNGLNKRHESVGGG